MFEIFLASLAIAATEPPASGRDLSYIDTNALKAMKVMEKVGSKVPSSLNEVEQLEWVKARLAWIALSRLQGRESEALKIFAGCDRYCERHAPEKEWGALKAWACGKKKDSKPCVLGRNTKAQKPPH